MRLSIFDVLLDLVDENDRSVVFLVFLVVLLFYPCTEMEERGVGVRKWGIMEGGDDGRRQRRGKQGGETEDGENDRRGRKMKRGNAVFLRVLM